jgi:hypothetical protein
MTPKGPLFGTLNDPFGGSSALNPGLQSTLLDQGSQKRVQNEGHFEGVFDPFWGLLEGHLGTTRGSGSMLLRTLK